MVRCGRILFPLLFLFFTFVPAVRPQADWQAIFEKVQKAYGEVRDYRVDIEVKTFSGGEAEGGEHFLYTFRKPGSMRLDFISPHPGMVLIYPDKKGKVAVKGLSRLITLHLAPDNRLLRDSSGQSVDTSDFGHLIHHLHHAVTDERRGPVEAWVRGKSAAIKVLAVNHFRQNRETLYVYTFSTATWLPEKVEQMTPEGELEKVVSFRDLHTNVGVGDDMFRLE